MARKNGRGYVLSASSLPKLIRDAAIKQKVPLGRIADMKTLQNVVVGLEELAGPTTLRTEHSRINYAPPFQDGLNRSELATWVHATSRYTAS